jgi:hypothetical protein
MRRTTHLKKMGMAHSKEEEKTKEMDKEEGMKENNKEEKKLHNLHIPLLKQSHRRRGRFLCRNLQQEKICVLVSSS